MPEYSDGSRTGELYKISNKGVIWKSWEGELKLSDFNLRKSGEDKGTNVFEFSSRDDGIGQQLEALDGHKVKIHYHQYMIAPAQQGSQYTVDKVERLD